MEVRLRPAALHRFADHLLGPDARLRDDAQGLGAVLIRYQRANPDAARDHGVLAHRLVDLAEQLVELDQEASRVATAVEVVDQGRGPRDVVAVADGPFARVHARLATRWERVDDLRDRVLPMARETWLRLVWGRATCPPAVAGGTYRGGGALRGPDGRRYPLVIPELEVDGRRVNLSRDPWHDPGDLGGGDPGWRTVHAASGVAAVEDDLAGWERAVVVAGVAAGLSRGLGSPRASERDHARLRFDASGWPVLDGHDASAVPAPAALAEGPADPVDRPPVGLGGRPRADARGGALDLAAGVGRAAVVGRDLEGHGAAAYRVVFEQHELEDRRRARLHLYDLRALDDVPVIVASMGYGAGGSLRRVPAVVAGRSRPTVAPRRGAPAGGGTPAVGSPRRARDLPPRYPGETR